MWCAATMRPFVKLRWTLAVARYSTSLTASDPHDPHDADDGRVDGNHAVLDLFQRDPDHGQHHNGHVQLIPPAAAAAANEARVPVIAASHARRVLP